ncbi:hypothetical protein OSB04_013913 [Centaurea solstitialis]|uniref:Disease resistance protein n=1 Tax=Centaurea solstitialis TaxID=347529 RepID=A0AA38TFX4_9ASTR|nr:hypothetical protein OSB04_013913 [Centaurea solstitialis]
MADAIVSGLVSDVLKTLASTAFQEFRRLRGLKDDVSALRDTYTLIQAVLDDAEVKQREQKAVEEWLRRLRSASLELEDILNDVVADAMLQRLRNELQRGIKYKVRAFFSSNHNPLLDRVRVANKVKAIRRKLEVIDAEKSRYQLTSNAGVVVDDTTNMEETTSLVPVLEIYGRDEEVKTVVEKICSKDTNRDDIEGVRVYALWGMGGMGKTTLAQLVYNHERVKAHFELRAWVYVSNDFQVTKLTRGILESLGKNSLYETRQLDVMQVELQKKLEGKRFLIVLDDVWIEDKDMKKWEDLSKALTSGAKGSIVMVTTRNETTSRMMATVREFRHPLGCLSEEDSWSLFKKLAFAPGSKSEGENISELEYIGKEVVKKCKGLPLAVKSLGGLMRSKRNAMEWRSVKDSNVWQLQEDGILPALKLSYDNLLPHMKRCFVYSCFFPKGYEMRKDSLIELWMANGFIPPREDVDLYVIGDEILYWLFSRSFLQDMQERYEGLFCKMHDLMHDLGCYLMKRDYLFTEPCKNLITPNDVEILHFNSSCPDVPFSDQDLKMLTSLRSLFISVDEYKGNMISQLSKHVYLRVLYLDGIHVSTLPESICKLKHLRYLSLCDSRIEYLPESIIYLQNLQVLRLRWCTNLRKLPEGMRYMKNLRCLDNEECNTLDHMPVGIKELRCLRRLGLFVVGEKKGTQITELEDLDLLGGRLELKGLENVGGLEEAKSANLKHKTHLSSLALCWGSYSGSEEIIDDEEEVVEGLEPNSSLKELHIEDYMGKMFCPSWMMKLRNLVMINFWFCRRCESIGPLGKLPGLKVIDLYLSAIRYLDDDEFPSLQTLSIRSCHELVSLPSNLPTLETLTLYDVPGLVSLPNNLPKLTRLHIDSCPKLQCLPNGLKELTSLTIIGCEELQRRCEKEKGEDWSKISHVPNLLIQDTWWPNSSESFLQDVQEEDRHNNLVCKMHDLMHDLGRYLMRRDYFFTDDLTTLNDFEVLHFSLSCPGISFSVQDLKRLRSLRSLFFFVDKYEGNMISRLSKLVYLRTLHLDGIQVSILPESICKLKHLRYLSLCVSEIESLPESIIYLQNLQVLLLRRCSKLSKLPKGIRYMMNLQCLDNQGCWRLDCMPVGIKELGCLTRLGLFVVGENKGSQITELGDLNLLGGRLELEGLENVGGLEEAKSANLKHKTNLSSLVLRWKDCRGSKEKIDDEEVVEGLEPSSSLKTLCIEGYMGKMICPSWMMKLRNLVKIEFLDCERCESIPPLGKLPCLKVIDIAFTAIRCLDDDEFPSLQELTILDCPQLVSLPNNLPKVTRLHIDGCPELHCLPNGLKELTYLEIKRCEELQRRCEKEKGEDWPKISHVPNLRLGYW